MTMLKLAGNAALIYFVLTLLLATGAAAQNNDSAEVQETEEKAVELSRQWSGEAFRHSIELFLKAADGRLRLKEPSKASNCWREAARLKFLLVDYNAAKAILKKAVQLDADRGDSISEAESRSLMSLILLQEGEIEQSESFYRKAVELADSAADFHAQAYAYYAAAEFSYFQNDADRTVKLFEESRSYVEKTGDSRLTAEILVELAYAYMKQGNGDAGLKTASEALAKWQSSKDKRGEALTYTAIGLAYKMLGDEQTALDNYYKSQEMFPPDIDLIDQARAMTGIASVYDKYGYDYLVEKHMRRAYFLFQNAAYPQGQISILPTLIKLSYASGQNSLAEEYYEEVKSLSKKLKNEFMLAFADETMGNEKLKNNLTDEALVFYNSALTKFERYKNRQFIALVNQRLGEAYLKKGDFEESKKRLISSLEYNRQIKDGFAQSQNLYYLARLNAAVNNYDEALENIKESISLTETLYTSVNNSVMKRIYFSNSYDRYEIYINFLVKMHARFPGRGFEIQALQAAEKARARIMLETLALAESDLTKDADAALIKREKEIRARLNTKADNLTDLLSRDTERAETEKISGEIKDLENELEDIRARLRQQSPIYSAIKNPAPFDLADYQQNVLDDNSLLLEFSFGKAESYLWLVGKNEISSYVLPPQEEIETSIEKLRELLKQHELKDNETVEDFQRRVAESEIKYRAEAKHLSLQLFGQIAGKLEKKRLIIVPDGELHYFPVSALPLPDSDSDEPILLTNETIYEPSAQTLAMFAKSQRPTAPSAKKLLVFSDPIFTSDDARFPPEKMMAEKETAQTTQNATFRFVESLGKLPRLASSKDESETIIKTVGAAVAENYSGFDATRENLINLKTDEYKILHFATHGYVNEEHPELSGIVLSRFDENGRKLNEFFRIHDIYAMNLNADLVVLSACETGIGKEIKGEGLMSLNNAFLQTGAKSVMASLWKVDDQATLELMKNFYGFMANEHLTPSEALRRAQIKLRENPQYKSPFYWAAFTVQGDFRNVPKISETFGFWVYLLPVFPLALVVGGYLYRRRKSALNKTV